MINKSAVVEKISTGFILGVFILALADMTSAMTMEELLKVKQKEILPTYQQN